MDWGSCLIGGVATIQCLPVVFMNVVNALFMFAGVVAVFIIMYSGVQMILAGGNAKQLEGARKSLTLAIVGLLIILLASVILNVIATITGVTCIQVFGPWSGALHGIQNCTK